MRKLLSAWALLLAAAGLSAQKQTFDYKTITHVTFYGVDYTKAKTYGARETVVSFLTAYKAINSLMVEESDKFDVGRCFKLPVYAYKTSFAIDCLAMIDPESISTSDPDYSLTGDEAVEVLDRYDFGGESGCGVLFVAELLNKSNAMATYTVILFDTATKEVLFMKKTWGEAGGFGLRNFWANSVYDMMNRWNWKY